MWVYTMATLYMISYSFKLITILIAYCVPKLLLSRFFVYGSITIYSLLFAINTLVFCSIFFLKSKKNELTKWRWAKVDTKKLKTSGEEYVHMGVMFI